MHILQFILLYFIFYSVNAQDSWTEKAENIDPNNYCGVTVANGMVGIVSSSTPLKVYEVILNGVFHYYQRGRVSHILKVFNHMNVDLDLLAYPMDIIKEPEDILRDLSYYEPRMSPDGPAMGNAILSLLYNRLGQSDKAVDIFTRSYKLDEVPLFGVFSETAGGTNPYFALAPEECFRQ